MPTTIENPHWIHRAAATTLHMECGKESFFGVTQEAAERVAQCAAQVAETEIALLLRAMTSTLGSGAIERIARDLHRLRHPADGAPSDAAATVLNGDASTRPASPETDAILGRLLGILGVRSNESVEQAAERLRRERDALQRLAEDLGAEFGLRPEDHSGIVRAAKARNGAGGRLREVGEEIDRLARNFSALHARAVAHR